MLTYRYVLFHKQQKNQIQKQLLRQGYFNKVMTICFLKEIPENAADIAHLTHLHTPGIVSGADLRYTNSKIWEFVRHDWKVFPAL